MLFRAVKNGHAIQTTNHLSVMPYSQFLLMPATLRGHVTSPLKVNGEIRKLLFLRMEWFQTISSTRNRDFVHSLQDPMLYFCIFDLPWRHLWRHTGHRSFSSITHDQIEPATRESHQWTREDLPNRMICDMTSFDQFRDLGVLTWPWPEVNTLSWPHPNKKYTIRRAWARQTRWCQNRCSAAILCEIIYQKPNLTLGFLTSPQRLPVDMGPWNRVSIVPSWNGAHACFFREALAPLGAKRQKGVVPTLPPRPAEGVGGPTIGPARVKQPHFVFSMFACHWDQRLNHK